MKSFVTYFFMSLFCLSFFGKDLFAWQFDVYVVANPDQPQTLILKVSDVTGRDPVDAHAPKIVSQRITSHHPTRITIHDENIRNVRFTIYDEHERRLAYAYPTKHMIENEAINIIHDGLGWNFLYGGGWQPAPMHVHQHVPQ